MDSRSDSLASAGHMSVLMGGWSRLLKCASALTQDGGVGVSALAGLKTEHFGGHATAVKSGAGTGVPSKDSTHQRDFPLERWYLSLYAQPSNVRSFKDRSA